LQLQIQEILDIPTICQRLFHNGKELLDNEPTLGELGVLAHDVLELREVREDEELLNASDNETSQSSRRKAQRDEGRGFGGTLLGGGGGNVTESTLADSASERYASPFDLEDNYKACNVCTLRNSLMAAVCAACETPFP
jgi:hypothetical protein